MAGSLKIAEGLQYARQRAGFTQARVREATGIGESSLSEFEHGKREPTPSQLAALASLYHRPISFFFSHERPSPEVVRWRQRPDASGTIEAEFLRLCEQYQNVESWCQAKTAADLPVGTKPTHPLDRRDAEALAIEVRRKLVLGEYPGPRLLKALEEQCGLKVFHLEFEPTGTAACTKSTHFGAAVLLNKMNPKWRRNFDLAHELFHLLTWEFLQPDDNTREVWSESDEKLADQFAAGLLMPADAVREAVAARLQGGKLSIPTLFEIARQFDVSVEALIWRIHAIHGGTPHDNSRTKDIIQRARDSASLFEERTSDAPPTRPARFVRLALTALQRGDMSIGRFAEYVGTTRQRAMQLLEQELWDDEAFELPTA